MPNDWDVVSQQPFTPAPSEWDVITDQPEQTRSGGLAGLFSDLGDLFSTSKQLTEQSNELAALKTEQAGQGVLRSNLRKYANIDDSTIDVISGVVNGRDSIDTLMKVISPEYKKQTMEAEQAARTARIQELESAIKDTSSKAQSLEARLGRTGSLVPQALGGLAGDPTQALPTVGALIGSLAGPQGAVAGSAIGSIPVTRSAFNAAYIEAKQLGADDDEAVDYANKLTAIQAGTEGLGGLGEAVVAKGAAKLGLKKATKESVQDELLGRIRSRLGRVAGAAAIEGTENTAQEVAGDITRATTDLNSPEGKTRMAQRVGQDTASRLDRYLDSFGQGAVAGGVIATPTALVTHAFETGQRQADLVSAAMAGNKKAKTTAAKAREEDLKKDTNLNLDIAREQERIRQEQAKEDAFRQAEEARAAQEKADAQRKADEIEAGFRTINLENQFRGQTRVERAGDSLVERMPINPPAEVTPEQVQAQRQQAEKEAADAIAALQKANAANKPAKKKAVKKTTTQKIVESVVEPTTTDSEARELARKAGIPVGEINPALNMAKEGEGISGDFEPKVRELVKGLVKDNSQTAVDVQNLINQGKLVIAENPESIGREDSGQAAYDTGEGKMYLYTDSVETSRPKAAIIAALHESTHGGQFNDRSGRPDVLRQMLGKTRYDKAQQVILEAARNGNTLARAARDKAKAAGDDRYLELVPYFVGEAAKARSGYGRLGGLVKDIKLAGKQFLQDKLGASFDLTLDDIDAAGQTMAGEIARTPLEGRRSERSLDMIGGEKGTGYQDATSRDKVYSGAIDKKSRYEFSDDDAPLRMDEVQKEELLAGQTHRLEKIIDHPELFRQYPQLRNLDVVVDPDLTGANSGDAYYDRNYKAIALSEDMLDRSDDQIQSLLLHEIQHAIQDIEGFVPGTNPGVFRNPELTDKYNSARTQYNLFIDSVPSTTEMAKDLPEATKKNFLSNLKSAISSMGLKGEKEISDAAKDIFFTGGFAEDTGKEKWRLLANRYRKLKDQFDNAAAELDNDKSQAESLYMRDYGETEARTTQLRRRLTPSQRKLIHPEEDMKNAAGKIPVESTLDTREIPKKRKDKEPVPAKSLNISEPYPKLTAGETKYFDSQRFQEDYSDWRTDRGMEWYDRPEFYVDKDTNTLAVHPAEPYAKAQLADFLNYLADSGRGDRAGVPPRILRGDFYRTVPKSKSLAMAREATTAPKENISVKERITRIVNDGTRAQTHDIKIAEHLDTRYRKALAKDVARPNDPKVLKEIEDTLTSTDNADPAAKKALWAKFKKKYPNLAPVLLDMRNKIDANSREVVRQMLNTGRELTPKETKQVVTVLSQEGKYLTRAYSAFQQRIGKEWADKRWRDFEATRPLTGWKNALRTAVSSGRKLSPAARRNAQAVLKGIDWLETKFGIPDSETLREMSVGDLEQMYEDHMGALSRLNYRRGGDETQARRNAMIDALDEQRGLLTPEQMREMAAQAAREILGLSERTSNVSKMFSSLARDPGTLNKRVEVPEPLRDLLGEIKDPAGRVLATMATQSALIARANVLTDLIKNHTGELVLPKSKINEPGMRKKFPVPLNGEEFGPLNSFYATREVAAKIKDLKDTYYTWQQAIDAMDSSIAPIMSKVAEATIKKVMAPITRTEKLVGVVANPINWATNFAGSPITMLMNGNLSLASAVRGGKVAKDYVVGNLYNTSSDMLNDAIRYLNIEAVDVAEMQHVLANKLKDYLAGNESAGDMMRRLRNGWRGGIAGYAMMDAWAKIANFHDRINVLQNYYKALGDKRSLEDIKREAGDTASYTNLSAERVPKLLRATESMGVSKFLPYFSETMRIVKTNYNQAFIDLERAVATEKMGTPGAKKAASIMRSAANRRFIGNTLATLFVPARFPMMSSAALAAAGLPTLFSLVPGFDDDAEEKRRMLNEFNRYQDMAQVGKDKDGNPIYYNVSGKMDPIGPVTDFIRLLVNSDNSKESYEKILDAFTDLYITPTWMKRAFAAATRDVVPESRINRIAPEQMEELREWMTDVGVDPTNTNKALYLMDSILPGLLKAQDPKYTPKPVGGNETEIRAAQYMGAQFETLNPKNVLRGYSLQADDALKSARSKLNDNLLNAVVLTEPKALDSIIRYASDVKEQQSEDQKNVASLRAWGYADDEIEDLLVGAGYSQEYAADLVEGNNIIPLSLQSLKRSVDNKKSGLTQDEIDKYDARLEEIDNLLSDMGEQLEAMGVEVR